MQQSTERDTFCLGERGKLLPDKHYTQVYKAQHDSRPQAVSHKLNPDAYFDFSQYP